MNELFKSLTKKGRFLMYFLLYYLENLKYFLLKNMLKLFKKMA